MSASKSLDLNSESLHRLRLLRGAVAAWNPRSLGLLVCYHLGTLPKPKL